MTQYRWEFGFDFNALPDYGTLNPTQAPGSPAAGEPTVLLQQGFCRIDGGSVVPAWPTSLQPGDSVEFFVYDLTSAQGTESNPTDVDRDESTFSVVDPHSGDLTHIFEPFSNPGLVELPNPVEPSVWPTGPLPAWQYRINVGESGNSSGELVIRQDAPPYAALSVLLNVNQTTSKGTVSKWFGLDPEVWIMDG